MGRSVAIIGGGPGGLAAAMLLAAAGADVSLHERLDHVGGRSATFEVPSEAGTFHFDRGATFFLYPRVLEEIFAACGRDLRREIDLIRVDPLYRVIFEDEGSLEVAADPDRLAAVIAAFSPADAAALGRYMARNRGKLNAFRPVLETPFDSVLDFLRPAVLRALPRLRPDRSLDRDLARHFSDRRVRLAFSFQSKYLGMSPFRCPSLFSILAFMEHEYGIWHPRGGCGAVMTRMAGAAEALGARMHLSDPVREILFEGRRAVGIRTDGGVRRADAIVLNADFAHAMRHLVPNRLRRRWSDRRIARKRFSCSTFMLYLGIEGALDGLAHHTIRLARDYRRNIAEIEAGATPPENPSIYVQNACLTDPGLAPPGHATLYALVPVGHRREGGIDWDSEAPRYRRHILDVLERLGVKDIHRRIRCERMVTPRGWEEDQAVHLGATFNLAHTMSQMLHRRPHNRFEDLDGVFLVGGGTHPGSGLPAIFESARISAKMIAGDLGLTFPHAP